MFVVCSYGRPQKRLAAMLKIRGFVQGKDEAICVSVWNKAFREFDEFRSFSVEDWLAREKSPSFDAAGMFIAELDNEPVGLVYAFVDKMREEKKGFIRVLGVVPTCRKRGIGRALAEKAIQSFKERGMQTIEAGARMGKPEGIRLFESMGFEQVRVFSLMTRDLKNIPEGVGENHDVRLRKFRKGSVEDLKLLNWLENEAFKEHYNFRPETMEETRFQFEQHPAFKNQECLFAFLRDKPLGYVGIGEDPKYNEEKKAKAGWITSIGVLKPHRLKGVGTRLMIEGMKLLKKNGLNEAMLGVDDQNPTKAIQLYEKLGFTAEFKDIAYQKTIQ
jgi:ribosomal protein S18 acetylase RimI-like enzyme